MLICSQCAAQYTTDEPRWRCDCGGYLHLQNDNMFNTADLQSRVHNLWRYHETLGIDDPKHIVSLGEGFTPLIADELHSQPIMIKMDQLNPTGSFKDRGTAVMISKLHEWGIKKVIEDSSGNAGASVSAYSARAGMQADVYIPSYTSAGKAAQIAMYGARLVKVPGTRENTAQAALAAAETTFYASHNWNPYFLTGLKTVAYEVAEQLHWQAPDWMLAPIGGGSLFLGIYLGWLDLLQAGIVDKMPRLVGVQALNCAPIYHAWKQDLDHIPAIEKKETAAEGISISNPVQGKDILHALKASNGVACAVTEEEIWETFNLFCQRGIYIEPTSAATPAAIAHLRADGLIKPDDKVVVQITGMGLKATDKILQHQQSR